MTTFASLNDLAILLGYDLTAAEKAKGQLALELVTADLVSRLGQTDEWAAALDPIPGIVPLMVLDRVAAYMRNPAGARSESETLGAYSHSTSFTDGAHGLLLTDDDVRACRWAIFGRRSGTFMPGTTVDLIRELAETGEIAEFPAT